MFHGKSPRKNEPSFVEKFRVRKNRSPDSVSEPERGQRKISYSEGEDTQHAGERPPYLDADEESPDHQPARYEQAIEGHTLKESLGHPLGFAPGDDSSHVARYPCEVLSGSVSLSQGGLDHHHLARGRGDGSHASYMPPQDNQPAVGSADGAHPAYPQAQDPLVSPEGGER